MRGEEGPKGLGTGESLNEIRGRGRFHKNHRVEGLKKGKKQGSPSWKGSSDLSG